MSDPRLVPYYAYPNGPQLGSVMVDGPPEIMALYTAGYPSTDPPPPIITHLFVAKCPNPTCEWEGDGELTEAEARASYSYHMKWAVHDSEISDGPATD